MRIHSRSARQGRHFRLALQPGASLYDSLVGVLASAGVANASMTLLGGAFSHLDYCTAPPDPAHHRVVAYTEPISAGPAYLIFGNATLGKTDAGGALVHCHAAFCNAGGEPLGGHIIAQTTIIGPSPISVLVTALDGFELRATYDAETNLRLLQPHGAEDHDPA
ncbi:PCC domain-containing protein [Achromobacter agilis]|uniref:PCC domain-containing protein n=1 Tax=Achromobacter agilis TaxID=1353888 RepID=UPI003CC586B3